jgi:hypothetical protein
MDETFELINIRTYYANNLESTRQAKQYADGRIEELPEPEYDEDFDEGTQEDEEDDMNEFE